MLYDEEVNIEQIPENIRQYMKDNTSIILETLRNNLNTK
jgi:hypothetical protein